MSKLKEWFDELKDNEIDTFNSRGSESTIYKGFKLSKKGDDYKIEDVRLTDFYSEVKSKDLKILHKEGFIKGVDIIVYNRNIKRIRIYTKIIERLYEDKKSYQLKLRPIKTRTFYQKKLRNCQENIHKSIDLLFLYKSRIEQYKAKYKLNVKKIKD